MTDNALTPAEMNALGRSVIETGDLDQAAEIFKLLWTAGLAEPASLLALGVASQSVGKVKEALEWTGRSVALDPDSAMGFQVLAHLCIEVEAFSAGADAARQALRLRPDLAEARVQLGRCLQKLGRPDEAATELKFALERIPSDPSAHLDLGNAYQDLGEWVKAEEAFIEAARLDPQSAKPYYNLGNLHQKLGRCSDALAAYDRAMEISPEDAAARVNAGLLQLTVEDFERGWDNFEWRWKAPSERPGVRESDAAYWTGEEDVSGKRVLIQSEQGLGDTLQFVRYSKALAARGAEVFVDAPTSLQSLLATMEGVHRVISRNEDLPNVDFRCPMMSLPYRLRIPAPLKVGRPGYLTVDPDVQRKWDKQLGDRDPPHIGLAYSGNAQHTNDRNRSVPLGQLLPHLPRGPRYFVLQTELRDGDLDLLLARDDVEWLGPAFKDFMDTAAVAMSLDLIVTVDTVIAHLAGALGRPTHLLVPFEPDWRWGFERTDCLWYPTITLHRQLRRGDWSHPLQEVSNIIVTSADGTRGSD